MVLLWHRNRTNCRQKMRNMPKQLREAVASSSYYCHCTRITTVHNFLLTVENLAYWCISLSIFINVITSIIVNKCFIISVHKETNQCTCCDVISHAICHACTYPAATQKGVADLCSYQLQCMCKWTCILIFSCYVT